VTEAIAIDRLKPAPWNPRLIKDKRFKQLCRSLEADPDFMEQRPILAQADGTVYGGNMRLRAAMHLGWPTVPAILADIPDKLAKERGLRDNNNVGDWQEDELSELIYELEQAGSDLDLLGFEDDYLQQMRELSGAAGDNDEALSQSVTEQYMIIIDCRDEMQQTELLDRLSEEGLTCRALLS
jgi:ParB-like chromosome segregation protein Spo0J